MSKRLAVFLASAHFAVIGISLCNPKVDAHAIGWRAMSWYGKLSGASASYSFFSPDIPREVLFRFTVYNKDQTSFETTLQDTANNEVNARLGNILRMIPRSFKSQKIVRSMAASLTASMFRIYPQAEKIHIRGLLYMLPSMEDYRHGERATLKPVYGATFARGPQS